MDETFGNEYFSWIEVIKKYEAEGGKWIVEGWASTTEVDSEGLRMSREAIRDMVKEYRVMTTVLHNHNPDEEVGTILETEERQVSSNPDVWGCWVRLMVSKTVPEIWQKVQEGVINKFSVRGFTKQTRAIENGHIISEAQSFKGAELSLVAVPGHRGAGVTNAYVEKMLKEFQMKGPEMAEQKEEVEKIAFGDAKEAIKDLITDEGQREAVVKLLESVEVTPPEETKKGEESEEKEPEKTEKEEAAALTPAEREVMESLANAFATLHDKVKAAIDMEPDAAIKSLKSIEAQMREVINAYPYPYKKPKKDEEEEEEKAKPKKEDEEKEEEEEKEEMKSVKKDEIINIIEEFKQVRKDLEETKDKMHDAELSQLKSVIKGMTDEMKEMKKNFEEYVPVRKGVSKSDKQRKQETEPEDFTLTEEYKALSPSDQMRVVFAKKAEREATVGEE